MRGLEFIYGNSILSEYDADGFLGIQIDAYGEEQSGVQTLEQLHMGGVQHRPRDPDDSGQAGALYFWEGPQGFVFSVSDPRAVAELAELSKGSTVLYAHLAPGAKSYILLDGASGDITIKTEGSGGTATLKLPGAGGDIDANGGKIKPDGDYVTPMGISLNKHKHPTAMGPSGLPLPS